MFDLKLSDVAVRGRASGILIIGTYVDDFMAGLSAWTPDHYRQSWARAGAHVLKRGYGRFLVSVSAPGKELYVTWVCRVRMQEAHLFKSVLLPSLTETYAAPEEAESPAEDYAQRNQKLSSVMSYRCPLSDIAAFQRRLSGMQD